MNNCARCGGPTRNQTVTVARDGDYHRDCLDCVSHLLRAMRTVHALIETGRLDIALEVSGVDYLPRELTGTDNNPSPDSKKESEG